ncbi:MAG: hypothetical protein IPH20_22955 [Bacteroidales bacterium]|nr:hypothetical protein [Bacteroidales bacterium]
MENPENNPTPVVTTGDWIITLLVSAIPLVNIIMLFVWSFGGGTNPNKANWAKAILIWIAISIVLWVAILLIFGSAFLGLMESGPDFIDNPSY